MADTLGGASPLLSMLTGVARGVTEADQKMKEQQRTAMLDRLRVGEYNRAEGQYQLQKQAADRAEEERARQAAGDAQRGADLEGAVSVRAGDLMKQIPSLGEGAARLRARAELTTQMPQLPAPPDPTKVEGDQLDIAFKKQRNANEARQAGVDTQKTSDEQKVQEVLRDPSLPLALGRIESPAGLVELQRTIAVSPEYAKKGITYDHLLAAWKQMGVKKDSDEFAVSKAKDQGTLDAESLIQAAGSSDAAITALNARYQQNSGTLGREQLARMEATRRELLRIQKEEDR